MLVIHSYVKNIIVIVFINMKMTIQFIFLKLRS